MRSLLSGKPYMRLLRIANALIFPLSLEMSAVIFCIGNLQSTSVFQVRAFPPVEPNLLLLG